jgi:hypothetical protein
MAFVEYGSLVRDIIIDLTALYFFAYVIVYRKFHNKELFVTFSFFNIFMLLVIMAITRTNFNIALGFGLFALLSMVQLRSIQFTKAEIGFLFGGVSLAVINGAGIPDLAFVLTCNFIIIVSAWIISGWSIEHSAAIIDVDNTQTMSVVMNQIDETGLNDHEIMKSKLSKLFNLDVLSFEIQKLDYVKDVMELQIFYQLAEESALNVVEQLPEENHPQVVEEEVPQSTISEFPVRRAAVGE